MTFKAIFFDIGGVVVKADLERYIALGADIFHTTPQTVVECARPLVPDLETGRLEALEFWERLGAAIESRGLGQAMPAWKFEGLWRGILEDSARVDHALLGLCRRLGRHFLVGALSNTIQEHADYLKSAGVYDPFEPCILSFEVGMRKPDANIYALAARKARVKPKQCVFIDDSAVNVAAAQAAGMTAIEYVDTPGLMSRLGSLGIA